MSFDWKEYCELAERLAFGVVESASAQRQEAEYRAACSRAYYGAFNVARSSLEPTWTVPWGANKHKFVIDRYSKYAVKGASPDKISAFHGIGAKLDRLRAYRNMADYDDVARDPPSKTAAIAVKTAWRVIEACARWAPSASEE